MMRAYPEGGVRSLVQGLVLGVMVWVLQQDMP